MLGAPEGFSSAVGEGRIKKKPFTGAVKGFEGLEDLGAYGLRDG
jgi:hypothetical protein